MKKLFLMLFASVLLFVSISLPTVAKVNTSYLNPTDEEVLKFLENYYNNSNNKISIQSRSNNLKSETISYKDALSINNFLETVDNNMMLEYK